MLGAGGMGQVYRARARFSMHLVTNWRRLLQKPARWLSLPRRRHVV